VKFAKAALAVAAVVVVAGALSITRPGYSVDEEYTVFAVRGIAQHGVPLLPSNLLYDRGIAYSYVSWLAGAITGAELPAFRMIGLLSAALVVLLTYLLVRRLATEAAALSASIFVTLSVPFWATATSGRFYAPFLAAFVLSLYFLTHRHWWIGLIAAVMLARLTHELAFLLAIIPAVAWLMARGDRRFWFLMMLSVGLGLVLGQLVLFGFHFAAPSSGETMVRRFFLWQVLNLFEAPGERQFMIPLVVLAVGVVLAPRRVWPMTVVALSVFTLILSMSIAQASNSAPLSWPLVQSVLVEGSRYPLDMFWHLMRLTPITLLTGIAFLVYRSRGEWPAKQRAAHLIWIGWVLWFGVIESGITTNYMLLPLSFVLIAIAIDAATILPRAAVIALALVIGVEQWRATTLAEARPTIVVEGIEEIKSGLGPNDRVVCTDELGCLMLVGRIDRWLALDEYVRERFLVRRGDGPVTGVYTGVPAVFRPADLFAPNPDGTLPDRIVVVDVFKDYPIGNSRSWLPKAIEEDGVKVTPLLETPQARVLEVSAPEALAIARLPRDQVARFK
jgi:4-amino-4-deoxy-L-arabinose transferase-like glycosyltransferase